VPVMGMVLLVDEWVNMLEEDLVMVLVVLSYLATMMYYKLVMVEEYNYNNRILMISGGC